MRLIWGVLCCVFLLANVCRSKKRGWSSSPSKPKENILTKGDTRLVESYQPCSGVLLVRSNESWLHVCDSTFTIQNAFAACRGFDCGFSSGSSTVDVDSDSWSATFRCSGQEEHLSDCPKTPLETGSNCRAVFLWCNEKPVAPEIKVYSTVNERYMYMGHPYVVKCSVDVPLKVRSFVLRVQDDYIETKFTQQAEDNTAHFFLPQIVAPTSISQTHLCQYDFDFKPKMFSSDGLLQDIVISEALYVRLEGESRCLGRLELQHKGEWRPVIQQQWGLKEAAVVCRQLDCGSVVHTHTQSSVDGLQPVWRFYSDCEGSERVLLGCGSVRESISISTVHLLCSDVLLPAVIRVESDKNFTRGNHTVLSGPYGFYMNCSVPPQFPGGHFSLVFSGNNGIRTTNQTAVNHSAIFRFDAAEKAHSGKYSCRYYNTVFGQDFSSESQELFVTVEDAEDVMLDDGVVHDYDHTVCSGTLFVKDGPSEMKMVAAESFNWDMRHASIVCRELGCGDAVATSKVKLPKVTPMWRLFSDCGGAEAALLQCADIIPWFSSTAIQVICAGKM